MRNWQYFLRIADTVAQSSKCLSRKVGAILVTEDGTIVGTGYNGPARGVPHCDSDEWLNWLAGYFVIEVMGDIRAFLLEKGFGKVCPRRIVGYQSGEGLHICQAGHAERNAIVNSAREGIRTKGCTLVVNTCLPCKDCMIEIINAGITRVVCLDLQPYDMMSPWLAATSGIEVIRLPALNYQHLLPSPGSP